MTPSVEDVQARIEKMLGTRLANQRALSESVARYGGWSTEHALRWPKDSRKIEGPAILDESLWIEVNVRYFPVEDLGSFPPDRDPPLGIEVRVRATSDRLPSPEQGRIADRAIEVKAWARATLGDSWSSSTYCLRPEEIDKANEYFDSRSFMVIVDRTGKAIHAPANFDFNRASMVDSPLAVTEFLISEDSSENTSEYMFSSTETFRDPSTNEDGTWKVNIVELNKVGGDSISTIQDLVSLLSVRGTVDHRFKPTSILLNNGEASLHFKILPREDEHRLKFDIPTRHELSEGIRMDNPAFRSGKMVYSTLEWAESVVSKIRNEFPNIGTVSGGDDQER
ncbi:hypothetical protein LQ424_29375 [Rhodococcus qingshengii]|uniref:hypothetical protein n=1 Tax=Rhodococcus qingshengii TaxID=334542 RepID=UPI001E2CE65A|nr:hypothetical protein [Rhodococcus qingshengii]MCD2135936.1 hypothetical protein [Rhodococcus qingshengii]